MKTLKNPLTFVLLLSAIIIIGSTTCCVGQPSANQTINFEKYDLKKNTENNTGVITITASNFAEKIKRGVTLVDFWASWCIPCKKQAPIIENVSKEIKGKAVIAKLDVDQNPSISAMYGVQGIPTMILFKNGKEIKRFVGLTSKEEIIAAINNIIK